MSSVVAKKLTASNSGVVVWLLVLFNSGGLRIIPNAVVTLLTLVIILIVLLNRRIVWGRAVVLPFYILMSLIIYNMLSTGSLDRYKFYIIQTSFLLLAVSVVVFFRGHPQRAVKDLFGALNVCMWHALLAFVAGVVLRNYAFSVQLMGSVEKTIFYIFYYPDRNTFSFMMRNQGLFWEPGILQYYMNVLLLMALIRKDRRTAFLAAFVVLTTLSTTGYVTISILLGLHLYSYAKRRLTSRNIVLFLMLPVLLVPLLVSTYLNIQHKFEKGFEGGGHSAMIRYYDFLFGLEMIADHPLLGAGLDADNIKNAYSTEYYGQSLRFLTDNYDGQKGLTSSIISAVVMWGIPVSIFLLWLIYRQQLLPEKKIVFFIITVLFLNGEPLFMSPYIMILQVLGLTGAYKTMYGISYNRK